MKSRKHYRMGLLLVVFIALATVFVIGQHPQVAPEAQKEEALKIYQSKNPALNFNFEYPAIGWTPKESQGTSQAYDAVQLLGPADAEKEYSAYFSVGVRTLKPEQLNEDFLSALVKESERFKGFRVLEEKKIRIEGRDHPSVTFEYMLRLPLWKKSAKDVLVKKTVVFITRGNRSYRISCGGTADQFKRYSPVFEKARETFRILL